ncbi:MAG: BolA/IbaG family iron-sulfur metabolism protein [Caldilineaceae bacterium]|nr:BolA/IbaG family iron-sulfur metabolism protein [Caldilineaceae bacterium]
MEEKIAELIRTAIPDARVAVNNPMQDGHHFEALVVSESFEGKSLVRQHQAVLNALKEQLASNVVHALAVKTFTPAKWDANKGTYPVDL